MAKELLIRGICATPQVSSGIQFSSTALAAWHGKTVPFKWNHRETLGKAVLVATNGGLAYLARVPAGPAAERLRTLQQAGEIGGSSISFACRSDGWWKVPVSSRADAEYISTIDEVLDVGPVRIPRGQGTSFSLHELEAKGGHQKRRPMIIPPPPRSMVNGQRVMEAAMAGLGIEIGGRALSASQVVALVGGSGLQAIV